MASSREREGGMFARFLHSEVSGSIVLMACTVAALVWANSPWAGTYHDLAHTYIGVTWGEQVFQLSLGHWIGDGLMVIFFFVVGLEIKREVVVGELSSMRTAALPVAAALGGMLVPAILYAVFNLEGRGVTGWGIPMATDIAFALGILALFGTRAPIGLKIFLTALAIADDLGAVLVIAVFYTEQISITALLVAGLGMLGIVLLGRAGVRRVSFYLVLMIVVWAAVLASGVHATVAGVLLAMLIPVKSAIEPEEFLRRTKRRLGELEDATFSKESIFEKPEQVEALDDLYMTVDDMRPAGLVLERALHPIQAFLILPLFALFKAGITLDTETLSNAVSPITIGIFAGLVFGKQIGILLASWLAVKSGHAELPAGVGWKHLWGVSCLAGVGFTMSIFISELAFTDAAVIAEAKLGVLVASLAAGIVGYLVLARSLPEKAG